MEQKKGIPTPEWVKSARKCCKERRAAMGEAENPQIAKDAIEKILAKIDGTTPHKSEENQK